MSHQAFGVYLMSTSDAVLYSLLGIVLGVVLVFIYVAPWKNWSKDDDKPTFPDD